MMAQYRRLKSGLPPGTLLLFRLGDFYEMFFEDAEIGASLLGLALTRRNGVPMCGVPYHAANGYLARLLRNGRRVAICDQLEEARPGKLVKREITQVLSPGVHFDERMLSAERPNYIGAVFAIGSKYGLALVDLTTADFRVTETDGETALLAELERTRPAELICPSEAVSLMTLLRGRAKNKAAIEKKGSTESPEKPRPGATMATDFGWALSGYDDWVFAPETAQFTLRDHFKVASLDGYGLRGRSAAIGAAGAVLHYLQNQMRRDLTNLTRMVFYETSDYLVLDSVTLRNLEVLEPLNRDAPRDASLFGVLNRTVTPMGARRLRDWLSQPLAAVEPIRRRQDAIEVWVDHPGAIHDFREAMANVRDLERTIGKISAGTGNARDLVALRIALEQVPKVREVLASLESTANSRQKLREPDLGIPAAEPADRQNDVGESTPASLISELRATITECPEVVDLIGRAIVDDPPLALKEGGLIRQGFNAELDELRRAAHEGKDWIAKLQQQEIDRTGIQSLKIRFNSVFGYYIEVTKANLDKVPPDYIRKQTIANGERFITPALKEMESRILGAEERAVQLEYDLFLRVREDVLAHLRSIQQTANALGQLDVLAALADQARLYNYCRPEVGDNGRLVIRDGRHPVLEQQLADERFVPNDVELDGVNQQIALITGPNMAGKSTYIRQVALLVLLAHTGSFIPATSATIDLVDRIFTRIGASDDLARGQSTFMIEMSETANILNNATRRSLVILDEIGRGTSTFDGLSLAWSIVEYIHNQIGAKTLFATHYHELTELAGRLPRLRNFNVAVREWNDQVVFLRRIVPGGTDKSYGIQVARLAGVPREVVDRAKVILANLEASELTPEGNVRRPSRRQQDRDKLKTLEPPAQLDLFG